MLDGYQLFKYYLVFHVLSLLGGDLIMCDLDTCLAM